MQTMSWREISAFHPETKDRLIAEYNRVKGFVPYEQGYVYAIQACGTNFYKIGKTINPDRRLLQIAPQMPFPTRFVKVWASNFMSIAEHTMHEDLKKVRANGEWFEFTDVEIARVFVESAIEYEQLIRHAYGNYLLKRIFETNGQLSSFLDLFMERSEYHADPGLAGGSADVINWIESIFESIYAELNSSPQDVKAEWKNLLTLAGWRIHS